MSQKASGKVTEGFFAKHRDRLVPVGVACIGILVSAVLLISLAREKKATDLDVVRDFWVDEETGEVTLEPTRHVPPINGKSGRPTLVVGRFITYGEYKDRQLSHLRKWDDEAKQKLEKLIAESPNFLDPEAAIVAQGDGLMVRRPGNPNDNPWVKASSAEGQEIVKTPVDANGVYARPVMPEVSGQ